MLLHLSLALPLKERTWSKPNMQCNMPNIKQIIKKTKGQFKGIYGV